MGSVRTEWPRPLRIPIPAAGESGSLVSEPMTLGARARRVGEVAWVFAKLGVTGFGGPAAHVAMIGAGGLGAPAALYLAAAGVGKLTLIFDRKTYQLRQWIVTDAQGLNTSVNIFNTQTGKPQNPNLYRITVGSQ